MSPLDRLREILAACEVQGETILIGDLNVRTKDVTSSQAYPRISPDMTGGGDRRSKDILELCSDYGLVILNGTDFQDKDSLGHLTSFQPNGNLFTYTSSQGKPSY